MPQRLDPASSRRRENARQKQIKAVAMRTRGCTWQQIADELGYSAPASAYKAVDLYFNKVEATPDIQHYRQQENRKLDALEQKCWEVLDREHVVIQHGKVVGRFMGWQTDPDTGELMRDLNDKLIPVLEEVIDDEPTLRTVAQLLAIYTRRAKLNGLDAPIVVKFEDEDKLDGEIEDLVSQINTNLVGMPPGHPERGAQEDG